MKFSNICCLSLSAVWLGRAGGADTDGQELHVSFGRIEQMSEPGFHFQTEVTNQAPIHSL